MAIYFEQLPGHSAGRRSSDPAVFTRTERMQPYRLTVDKFLDHAAKWFGAVEIVEADAGRAVARATYAHQAFGSLLSTSATRSFT